MNKTWLRCDKKGLIEWVEGGLDGARGEVTRRGFGSVGGGVMGGGGGVGGEVIRRGW